MLYMLAKNDKVLGHCFDGVRFDTGNVLVVAVVVSSNKRRELQDGLADILTEMQQRLSKTK